MLKFVHFNVRVSDKFNLLVQKVKALHITYSLKSLKKIKIAQKFNMVFFFVYHS